jgi:hypothetical protein
MYHKKKLIDITVPFLNMIVLLFPLVYVVQPIIKTLFPLDGFNMARCSSGASTLIPFFSEPAPILAEPGRP